MLGWKGGIFFFYGRTRLEELIKRQSQVRRELSVYRVLLRKGPFSLSLPAIYPSVEQALKASQKASSLFSTRAIAKS